MSDIKNIADYLKSEEKEIKLYHKNGKKALWYLKDSDGFWFESTYDENVNELTFKNSDGFWFEKTYDENGNRLTYKSSDGVKRGFDTKELTIEEIQKELGYKIKIVE